jgi:hypothetical protein
MNRFVDLLEMVGLAVASATSVGTVLGLILRKIVLHAELLTEKIEIRRKVA